MRELLPISRKFASVGGIDEGRGDGGQGNVDVEQDERDKWVRGRLGERDWRIRGMGWGIWIGRGEKGILGGGREVEGL